jgi:DNA-binding NarL/FixJ family response regulator
MGDGRRVLRYLALRVPVGVLGGLVVLLLVVGIGVAVRLGTAWIAGEAFDGMTPSVPLVAYFFIGGLVLLFLDLSGVMGVHALERRLARRVLAGDPTVALERRIAELAESRAGIVAAVDSERRRIERDLHDGLQQRLVALSMLIGRSRRGRPELLDQAHSEAQQALAELREVAWRVYPSGLDSLGLGEALAGVGRAGQGGVRAAGAAADGGGDGGVLRGERGGHQRRQARRRRRHHRGRADGGEPARRTGAGRRGGRRAPGGRRAVGAAAPGGRAGRRVRGGQPARRADDDHGAVAMRVILAEDSTLLREGLVRLLLEEGHQVPAAVGDGDALVEAVAAHRPDIVVVDVRMPPTHTDEGLRAALEIRRRWPEVKVLVLSQYVEKRYATELMSADVSGVGYLLKDRVAQVADFLDALDRVGAGGAAFDPEVVRQLLARTTQVDPLARLTPREREVLERMAQGLHRPGSACFAERSGEACELPFRQAEPLPRHRLQPPRAGDSALPGVLKPSHDTHLADKHACLDNFICRWDGGATPREAEKLP